MSDISTKIVELLSGVYVIPGATNIGVILNQKSMHSEVYLVDSGCTEIDADYILSILETFFAQRKEKYKIRAIINTHGHTDHSGANSFIQEKTGCQVWAPLLEVSGIENPLLQATEIWGGMPPHEIQTSYFKQTPSKVSRIINEDVKIRLSDRKSISFLTLPGHCFEMTAVIFHDRNDKKVVFAGDGIFTRDELSKHWIPYMYNPLLFLESLDKLELLKDVAWCIPSHGDFIKRNLHETIEMDKLAILETKTLLLNLIASGKKTTEELLKEVADLNEIKLGFGQSVLIQSTLKSYLAGLHDRGEIKVLIENNRFYWCENPERNSTR